MATTAESTTFTYPQLRARIAETLLKSYSRDEIIERLLLLDYHFPRGEVVTDRSLAYKLAWRLLPAVLVYSPLGPSRSGTAI